jgi:ATP-dependent Clp protease, protease subunit
MNTLINEETEFGEVAVDIYSKLASNRILFISDDVDDKLATDIVATLFLLDGESPNEEISLIINSEGGDIRSVFMIYDILQIIQSPIKTICVGSAMDEVVLLLASGTPGMRYATQNAVICPSQLIQEEYHYGNLTNAKEVLGRIQADNKDYMTCLAKKTNKKYSEVMSDFERRKFMTSKQAKNYGIIDGVIGLK